MLTDKTKFELLCSHTVNLVIFAGGKFANMLARLIMWDNFNDTKCTVKHLLFACPYFLEATTQDIFTGLYFRDLSYIVL